MIVLSEERRIPPARRRGRAGDRPDGADATRCRTRPVIRQSVTTFACDMRVCLDHSIARQRQPTAGSSTRFGLSGATTCRGVGSGE